MVTYYDSRCFETVALASDCLSIGMGMKALMISVTSFKVEYTYPFHFLLIHWCLLKIVVCLFHILYSKVSPRQHRAKEQPT